MSGIDGVRTEASWAELRETFVLAMGNAATPVSVVTTGGPGGRFGQTVSAMSSVSADPPLVLACIHRRSPITAAIQENELFRLNVLAVEHDHVADTFAGRPWPGKRRWDFTCGSWELPAAGAPRLLDALASFECALEHSVRAATHRVFLGRVRDVRTQAGTPLVYSEGTYGRPEPVTPSAFPEYPDAHPANR